MPLQRTVIESPPAPTRPASGVVVPANRAKDLQSLRALSQLMDDALPIPGTKFRVGLDFLIGLIPGVGDLAGTAISGYALLLGARLGAPAPVLMRMLVNIGIDALAGAVPVLGDLFDLGWKANRRNLHLLEQYVMNPAPVKRASLGITVGVLALFVLLLGCIIGLLTLLAKGFAAISGAGAG